MPIVGNMTEVQLRLTLQGTKYYKDDDLNKPQLLVAKRTIASGSGDTPGI